MSRKLEPVVLTDDERQVLEGWASRSTVRALALRARIVLACAAGLSVTEVAAKLVDSYGLALLQCDVATAVFDEYGSAASGFQPKC